MARPEDLVPPTSTEPVHRAGAPVIKQYGERRTGTNVLRALVRRNHPDATVLMHVLGDKHSPPVDLAAVWAGTEGVPERGRAGAFVRAATLAAPSITTDPVNDRQGRYVADIAPAVAGAFTSGSLRYLLSVRDPYTWLVSVLRFHGALPAGEVTVASVQHAASVCARSNRFHRALAELLDRVPDDCLVVPVEDVLHDGTAALLRIERTFGLRRRSPTAELLGVDEAVLPAVWDQSPLVFTDARDHPPTRADVVRSAPALAALVTARIDWEVQARFGYAPLG